MRIGGALWGLEPPDLISCLFETSCSFNHLPLPPAEPAHVSQLRA